MSFFNREGLATDTVRPLNSGSVKAREHVREIATGIGKAFFASRPTKFVLPGSFTIRGAQRKLFPLDRDLEIPSETARTES